MVSVGVYGGLERSSGLQLRKTPANAAKAHKTQHGFFWGHNNVTSQLEKSQKPKYSKACRGFIDVVGENKYNAKYYVF